MRLSDVSHEAVRKLVNLSGLALPPVLAINLAAAATVKTTNAINYSVGGLWKTKAALAAQVLATDATLQQKMTGQAGYYAQPANTTAYLVGVIDAAGVVKFLQTGYSAQPYTPFVTQKPAADLPSDIGDYVPFGLIKVVTGATTFTPITDALDKAAVTFTFTDLTHLPATNP